MKEKRTLLEWVRQLLGRMAPDIDEEPKVPTGDVVTSLIERASDDGEKDCTRTPSRKKSTIEKDAHDDRETGDREMNDGGDEETDDFPREEDAEKKGCSYAVKRNIVASLQEIRRFAEEHQLAGTMVRALLTLLAEMAIGALRGKVSSQVLDTLLKVFSYESAIAEAYSRGEKDGRNAEIVREYFPANDDGLPHL